MTTRKNFLSGLIGAITLGSFGSTLKAQTALTMPSGWQGEIQLREFTDQTGRRMRAKFNCWGPQLPTGTQFARLPFNLSDSTFGLVVGCEQLGPPKAVPIVVYANGVINLLSATTFLLGEFEFSL